MRSGAVRRHGRARLGSWCYFHRHGFRTPTQQVMHSQGQRSQPARYRPLGCPSFTPAEHFSPFAGLVPSPRGNITSVYTPFHVRRLSISPPRPIASISASWVQLMFPIGNRDFFAHKQVSTTVTSGPVKIPYLRPMLNKNPLRARVRSLCLSPRPKRMDLWFLVVCLSTTDHTSSAIGSCPRPHELWLRALTSLTRNP